jgi:hypothetical protein
MMSEDLLEVYAEAEVHIEAIGDVGIDFFSINEQDLSGEIERQAAYYAFWTTAEADAARDAANAKLDLKVMSAKVHKEIIAAEPKMRVGDIAAWVTDDARVVEAERNLIDREHRLKMIKAISMALQQKKDMLSSKTGLMRTEMEVHLKEAGIKALGGVK